MDKLKDRQVPVLQLPQLNNCSYSIPHDTSMTEQQLQQLQKMRKRDIWSKYKDMALTGDIPHKTHEWLTMQGTGHPCDEFSAVLQSEFSLLPPIEPL